MNQIDALMKRNGIVDEKQLPPAPTSGSTKVRFMSRPTKETDAKLKPCPFCGNAPDCDNDPVAPRVTCQTLGCAMAWLGVATDKWNTRATSALERQRDELAEALRQWLLVESESKANNPCPDYALMAIYRKKAIEMTTQALATKEGGV